MNEKFSDLLRLALVPVRKALGFPETNPVAYSYQITPEVLAAASDPRCEQALERISAQTDGLLFPDDLAYAKKTIKSLLPKEDAAQVVSAIVKTKSREHLSAISLTTAKSVDGELYVSLANPLGDALTLEAWKFVKLLEEREKPHLLATLSKLYQRGSDSRFAFKSNKSGEVLAQFNAQSSVLYVFCRNEENHEVADQAKFIIDIDYALCLYLTLKRLREDKERFARLKEQADTTVHCELFDNLFIPLRDKESL